MKIAFLHYHLHTGGVTTVIRQQIETLKNDCSILLMSGEAPATPFAVDTAVIPGLSYDSPANADLHPQDTARAVLAHISTKWPHGCDILHVHNPTLGKNRNFIKTLKILQKKGVRLLLQIHDFAEDGRPLNCTQDPYPAGCHYAVINSRDHAILVNSGLKPAGLHLLANAVSPFSKAAQLPTPPKRVLYPIRAIRRKNIGEAILLSLFFSKGERLGFSLPPISPLDVACYLAWKDFVRDRKLAVDFDVGLDADFQTTVASATFLLTTSITEGFGFSFLAPWSAGKLLCGRCLPDICRDFTQNGVNLNHLYDRLLVPLEWFDATAFCDRWKEAVIRACARLEIPLDQFDQLDQLGQTDQTDQLGQTDKVVSQSYQRITRNNCIDFGLLAECFQKEVILILQNQKTAQAHLIRLNPYLADFATLTDKNGLIQSNQDAVSAHYHLSGYRKRLLNTYAECVRQPVGHKIDKKRLAAAFLDLNRFSLLKWGVRQ